MTVRYYSSIAAESTLVNSITGASTSIQLVSVTGLPILFPYVVALDYESATEELVQVTNAAGTTLTVVRAYDGTSAQSHNAGARVRHTSSAQDFRDSREHENAAIGIHGLAPADTLVGETKVQTLSNKTLSSPTISGTIAGSPSFSGTLTGTSVAMARYDNVTDVSLTSTNHAFQIGPTSGANMRMDSSEIQAVSNGVASNLQLNNDGGEVDVFSTAGADSTVNMLDVNGEVEANTVRVVRATSTTPAFQSRANADTTNRFQSRADGFMQWGPGGAAAVDTSLQRTGSGILTIDSNLATTNLDVSVITTLNVLQATGLATINDLRDTALIPYKPVRSGTENFVFSASSQVDVNVVFPTAFATVPKVVTSIASTTTFPAGSSALIVRAYNITTTGMTLRVQDSGGVARTLTITADWIATKP